jgi:S-adenosylmethionine synthetase
MELSVGPLRVPAGESLEVEIVERKGRGHPDTICDALAEQLSVSLCRAYMERFGSILHHNVDKALLWGGAARPAFGGGQILSPIEIYLAGRATGDFRGVDVPVMDLAVEGSRAWLARNLRMLDPERHVRIHCLVRPSSADLVDLFLRQRRGDVPLANDTSVGVGYAPLTVLERLVAAVEGHLNSPQVKQESPEIGEDVKVLGIRRGRTIGLTVACALVDRFVAGLDDYLAKKERVRSHVVAAARDLGLSEIGIAVNTADRVAESAIYLTVTGTSAEAGDDGQAGRGNRANGLITPYRPMTLEAAAGKNPVSHVGKLYQIVARRIAEGLVAEQEGVRSAECYLVSQIGRPVTDPQLVDIRVGTTRGAPQALEREIVAIVRRELDRIPTMWREVLDAGLSVF